MGNKHRSNKIQPASESTTKSQSINRYEVLNIIMEEGEGSEAQKAPEDQQCEEIQKENKGQKHKETTLQGLSDMEPLIEDMDLGDLDLDVIEKACDNLTNG